MSLAEMTGGRALGRVSPRSPLDLQPHGVSALPGTRMGRTPPSKPSALDCGAGEQAVVADSAPAVQIDPWTRPVPPALTGTGTRARGGPFPLGLQADAR